MDARERPNLTLIGFMGTGKSAVGARCARMLGYAFHDSDAWIEARAGETIPALFARTGEAEFRRLEREAIAELSAESNVVLATGGGAVLDPENVARLRASGPVILLTAAPETLWRRVRGRTGRPLLTGLDDPRARLLELLAERAPRYAQAAHAQVDTTRLSLHEAACLVVARYLQLETSSDGTLEQE